MIKSVTEVKEIRVGVVNEVGILSKITSFLVNHGINIEAIFGYSAEEGQGAGLTFITDNNPAAVEVLNKHGYVDNRENNVLIIELENTPGALKNISECLAQENINIGHIYGTTCSGGCPAKLVLSTSDDSKAFAMLSSQKDNS